MIMEDVVRRYREGTALITAMMAIGADTEHTRYAVVTDADGRLVGTYFPADMTRQTGWHVLTPRTRLPFPSPPKPTPPPGSSPTPDPRNALSPAPGNSKRSTPAPHRTSAPHPRVTCRSPDPCPKHATRSPGPEHRKERRS
ncbi:hypothetical protein GCM10023320_24260 [Pseudonocardia adelaidensis]|uniref:Uncharacterized protein n=1 Tax=Pseudonocardia adelaidensis TaxID=648754 RepID=A0ABP9NIA6_9PSEU